MEEGGVAGVGAQGKGRYGVEQGTEPVYYGIISLLEEFRHIWGAKLVTLRSRGQLTCLGRLSLFIEGMVTKQ